MGLLKKRIKNSYIKSVRTLIEDALIECQKGYDESERIINESHPYYSHTHRQMVGVSEFQVQQSDKLRRIAIQKLAKKLHEIASSL
jgi:hypothetical protein